jgi:BlaI family transcriptional regulator, penicillinase repressor
MTRRKSIKLAPFELEIMGALWELGRASVREIQELLPETRRPAYTTVQTMVYRLEQKGALERVRKIGNAHVFEPLITRGEAHGRLINDLLNLFDGSVQPLMAHLVEAGKLTLNDLRELEKTLQKHQRSEESPAGDNKDSPALSRKGGKSHLRRKTS